MNELHIKVDQPWPKIRHGAKDPLGAVSADARRNGCEVIKAFDEHDQLLEEWHTPLCTFTESKIAERLMNLGHRAAANVVLGVLTVVESSDGRSEEAKADGPTTEPELPADEPPATEG